MISYAFGILKHYLTLPVLLAALLAGALCALLHRGARLRGKIDHTAIGFRFLEDPQAFSLGELQTVFEAVLGEAADSSNFRRTILNRYARDGRLEQTDQEKRARGRPAALYRIRL